MKAMGVDTEDDIYLLSSYFLNRVPGLVDGEQAAQGAEKDVKKEDVEGEKRSLEEKAVGMDEAEKKDDEGSVVYSVDDKASDSSSVKAHLSGNVSTDFSFYIRKLKQQRRRRPRKRLLKSKFALLQTLSHLFHLPQFVKCRQIFLELNSERLSESSEKRKRKSRHVLHKTWN